MIKLSKRQLQEMISQTIKRVLLEKKFDPVATLSKPTWLNQQDMYEFMRDESGLSSLGEGSARAVFLMDSKRAIKIAMNAKGISQNEAEIQLAVKPEASNFAARIYTADPQKRWLVCELVRPLTSEDEFENLTGINFGLFTNIVRGASSSANPAMQFQHRLERMEDIRNDIQNQGGTEFGLENLSLAEFDKMIESPFLGSVLHGLKSTKSNLVTADLTLIDHWGKTPDQRVVLLDYGYTEDVYAAHYKRKPLADLISSSSSSGSEGDW